MVGLFLLSHRNLQSKLLEPLNNKILIKRFFRGFIFSYLSIFYLLEKEHEWFLQFKENRKQLQTINSICFPERLLGNIIFSKRLEGLSYYLFFRCVYRPLLNNSHYDTQQPISWSQLFSLPGSM